MLINFNLSFLNPIFANIDVSPGTSQRFPDNKGS